MLYIDLILKQNKKNIFIQSILSSLRYTYLFTNNKKVWLKAEAPFKSQNYKNVSYGLVY